MTSRIMRRTTLLLMAALVVGLASHSALSQLTAPFDTSKNTVAAVNVSGVQAADTLANRFNGVTNSAGAWAFQKGIVLPGISMPTTIGPFSGSQGNTADTSGLFSQQFFYGTTAISGDVNFNQISASNGLSSPNAESNALEVNQSIGPSTVSGQMTAVKASLIQTGQTGNHAAGQPQTELVAIDSFVVPSFTEGGNSMSAYGVSEAIHLNVGLGTGATFFYSVLGAEIDISAHAGSSVTYKSGIWIIEDVNDAVQGSLTDSAITIAAAAPGLPGWTCILCVGKADAYSSTNTLSTLIGTATTNGHPVDLKYGVDFNGVTGTSGGYAFRGPSGNFSVDWLGNIVANGLTLNSQTFLACTEYNQPTTGQTHTPVAGACGTTYDPAGTLATFTAKMPASAVPGQEYFFSFSSAIGSLTVDGNGGVFRSGNAPTSATAGQAFKYCYNTNTVWYPCL